MGAAIALAAMGAIGCDDPPDVHVRVYSVYGTSADYAMWRVRHGRLLRARDEVKYRVPPASPTGFLPASGGAPTPPVQARFRAAPWGRDEERTRGAFEFRRRMPARPRDGRRPFEPYIMIRRVYFDFVGGEHRQFALLFEPPRPRELPAGPGGSYDAECDEPPPGCRVATAEDVIRYENIGPPPLSFEIDDDAEWGLPPAGFPVSERVIQYCSIACETQPASRTEHAPTWGRRGDTRTRGRVRRRSA